MSIITTVTLNPSIDVPIAIDCIALGATNRCASSALEPGGKGLNASRVMHRLGAPTLAVGFAGGITGALLRHKLDEEGVPHAFEEVEGMTRLDVMLFERLTNRRTRLLAQGPQLDVAHFARLHATLHVRSGDIVVFGGSIPPGLPATIYRDAVAELGARGARCIVDASGEALALALEAKPALVKPNEEEAAEAVGRSLRDDIDFLEAAIELRARGAAAVVISLGARGAVAVDATGAWRVRVPQGAVRSTVGSGDSMVAGLATGMARGQLLPQALALGAAAGTATAMAPGRNLCSAADVQALLAQISVERIDALLVSAAC